MFETIAVQFNDIPDVINNLKRTRTFQSRLFKRNDKDDKEGALAQLEKEARKHGFTAKDIIKVKSSSVLPSAQG